MRVLISGGGTGGHVSPALAVADAVRERYPHAAIEFAGAKRGIENKIVPQKGYKLHAFDIIGLSRRLSPDTFKFPFKLISANMGAKKLIKMFKPDVVIGTGGYASYPAVRAAAKSGVPAVIIEQDVFPGIATRMLSKYADLIFICFDKTREYLTDTKKGCRIILSGNPISGKAFTTDYTAARRKLGMDKFFILSYGGSMGALKINESILDVFSGYSSKEDVYHLHATGNRNYNYISEKYNAMFGEKPPNIDLREYIYDMNDNMAAADIVICRSGAITLAELAAMGKCAVLIPSPNVTNDHQSKNAEAYAEKDAALIIRDSELNGDVLIETIRSLRENKVKREILQKNIKTFANPNASNIILEGISSLIKKSKSD